jgi:hypothetical protein
VTLGFAGHTHTQKSVPHVFGKAEELALHILYSTYQSTLYSKIRDPDPKDPGTVHQSVVPEPIRGRALETVGVRCLLRISNGTRVCCAAPRFNAAGLSDHLIHSVPSA